MTALSAAIHVLRTTTTLAVEFNLILIEAACEAFLDVRRGPVDATILDWREVA